MEEPRQTGAADLERLRRRADFLRVAKGKRFHARGLTLQSVPRAAAAPRKADADRLEEFKPAGDGVNPAAEIPPRFGFTVTRHSGGAVQRNRIRRRLKEALRLLKPLPARLSHDYVIVARPEAISMSFRSLQAELMRAFSKVDARNGLPLIRPDHGRAATVLTRKGEARRKSSKGRTPKG